MSDIRDLIDMTQGGLGLPPTTQAVPQAKGTPVPTTLDPKAGTPAPAPVAEASKAPTQTQSGNPNAAKLGDQIGLPPFVAGGQTNMSVESSGAPANAPATPTAQLAPVPPLAPTAPSAAELALQSSIFGTPAPVAPPPAPLQNLPGQPPLTPEYLEESDAHEEWNGETHDPDGDDVLGEALSTLHVTAQAHPAVADVPMGNPNVLLQTASQMAVAPAAPAPAAVAVPPAPVAAAAPAAVSVPALPVAAPTVVAAGAADDETVILQKLMQEIEGHIRGMFYHTGISILSNPNLFDAKQKAHRAIRLAKWELDIDGSVRKVLDLPPQDILDLGTSLSAHQIWIASMENEWQARFEIIGGEFDRLMMCKREQYPGGTKGEKEIAAIRADPNLREFRRQYFLAKAMKTLLCGMGDRFQQFENAFKRPADWKAEEMRKNQNWTR